MQNVAISNICSMYVKEIFIKATFIPLLQSILCSTKICRINCNLSIT